MLSQKQELKIHTMRQSTNLQNQKLEYVKLQVHRDQASGNDERYECEKACPRRPHSEAPARL